MRHKIRVLIIDSEPESLLNAKELLLANPLVSTIECANDSDEALLKIINNTPDIVLLEYPEKGKAEKELIKFIQTKLTGTILIFVSKTKEFAADAIHNGVFDYLVKPVSKVELEKITSKVHLAKQSNFQERINEIIEKTPEERRFKFQTTRGYLIVDPEEILYCKADGFCSEIYLTNDRVEIIYLFLSKLDEILGPYNFMRVSRTYLINQKYIRKIYRGKNAIILSCNGKEYEIKSSKLHMKKLISFDTE